MTDRELMEQTQEAVSKAYDMTAWGHTERAAEVLKEARTALRKRLAQPEPGGVCGRCGGWVCDPVVRDEQEPVGVVAIDTSRPHIFLGAQHLGQKPDTKTAMLLKDLPLGTSLYTSPQPAREWVGLTDDEREQILNEFRDWGFSAVARAIEAKLREKNT